jgi:hypothetical protein
MKLSLRSRLALRSLVIGLLAALVSCSKESETASPGQSGGSGESTLEADTTEVATGTASGKTPEPIPGETAVSTPGEEREGNAEAVSGDARKPDPTSGASDAGSSKEAAAAGVNGMTRFLAAETDDQRIATLKDLAASGSESLRSVVETAMEDESAAVREEAARAAGMLGSDEAVEILKTAAREGSIEEAVAAIEVARELDAALRMMVLNDGLKSEDPGARRMAILEIGEIRPKYDIQHVFPSLNDRDPTVGVAASDTLNTIFGRRFSNTAEAEAWWGEHAMEYDEKLVRVASEAP